MNPWTLPEESEPEPGDVTDTRAVKPLGKEQHCCPRALESGADWGTQLWTSVPPMLL